MEGRGGEREGGPLHPVVCYSQQSNFLPVTVMTLLWVSLGPDPTLGSPP